MTSFLEIVADDLFKRFNGDFTNVVMVFPNKRASLFFNHALTQIATRPIWSPHYITISDLFREHSTLEVDDHIRLVCELYAAYREVVKTKETLDEFYGWGELLLTDFDDIDKHMADAEKVFKLLSDVHELDGVDYLTESQIKALQRFFSNFSPDHTSELKRRFLELWSHFYDIYTTYRQRLMERGLVYEGMLYRDVIERAEAMDNDPDTEGLQKVYVFVGFNLLNEVEQRLFSLCERHATALYYWDFDHYYMSDNEAGKYIAEYKKTFPNALPDTHPTYDNFAHKETMTFIASPTEDLQARYVSQWLTPERIAAGPRTAIVLANEALLDTVLHCLPPEVKHVNVTTGYPLAKASIASLVQIVARLLQRKTFRLRAVNAFLRHPYARNVSPKAYDLYLTLNALHNEKERQSPIYYPNLADLALDENLTTLFTPVEDTTSCAEINARLMWLVKTVALSMNKSDDLALESIYRMHNILNRLSTLITPEWNMMLYHNLLVQIIHSTTVPFHGEPIEGIQVIGVLETRNLDFDHVLLLSCNEGNLPAHVDDSSFLPHAIRHGYGLTTIDNKVALYAYHFHRLLQRATDVSVVYNSSANGTNTGEMSRFMLQMLAESDINIRRGSLMPRQESHVGTPGVKTKTAAMVHRLLDRGTFSPSALGSYLRCPVQYYYKYITGIQDDLEDDEETMDSRTMGLIFHKAAQLVYEPYKGREVSIDYIDGLLKEKSHISLQRFVDEAFRQELFGLKDSSRPTPRLNGIQMINRDMVMRFLIGLLEFDKRTPGLKIHAMEERVCEDIVINVEGQPRTVQIGGIVDRLDTISCTDGSEKMRVIDYKTGKYKELKLPSVEAIFDPVAVKNHSPYFLQAFMYSVIVSRTTPLPVVPALLYVQQTYDEGYAPYLTLGDSKAEDISAFSNEYMQRLRSLIEEILDQNKPFEPTPHTERCKTCAFAGFCS